jgi:hypothetical protein
MVTGGDTPDTCVGHLEAAQATKHAMRTQPVEPEQVREVLRGTAQLSTFLSR